MSLEDVLGHTEALARLVQAWDAGRLAHGHLFAGPDGIGKRTAARALFAATACAEGKGDFCGTCATCTRVDVFRDGETDGPGHPDLLEIGPDERGVIKIDVIRDLQHRLSFQPFEAPAKLAIVDGAHRMNEAAANAFLKTLEEPPRATVLVLVTPAPASLMPTILSRTQRVSLRALRPDEIVRLLERDPDLDADARRVLALHAEGSYGHVRGEGRERILEERPSILRALLALRPDDAEKLPQAAEAFAKDRAKLASLARWARSLLHDVAMAQSGAAERIRNVDFEREIAGAAERTTPASVAALFDRADEIARAQDVNVNRRLAADVLLRELAGVLGPA